MIPQRLIILDQQGNSRPGVKVEILLAGSSERAQLYAFADPAGPSRANPMTTDTKGVVAFYAPDGNYDVWLNRGESDQEFYDTLQIVDVLEAIAGISSGGGGGGTGGGGQLVRYAYATGTPEFSLGHSPAVAGQPYAVGAFSPSVTEGSAGLWVGVDNLGSLTAGSVADDAGLSTFVLTGSGPAGARPRFKFIAPPGSVVDPRSLGFDPAADGNEAWMATLAARALANGWKLETAGTWTVEDTVALGRAVVDFGRLKIKEPVAGLAKDLITLTGATIGTKHESRVWAEGNNAVPNPGIGQYQFQTASLATGAVWGPDGQGNAQRHFSLNRLKVGAIVRGNTEKHGGIHFDVVANAIAVMEDEVGGSPDSNVIHIAGAYNGVVLATGNSTSGHYLITHEARIDQGLNITDPTHPLYNAGLAALGQVIPEPGIYIRSGKYHWVDVHEWRGMNGRVSLFIHKDGDDGADTARVDGTFVHNYGCTLWVNAVQRLSGAPIINDNADGRSNYAQTASNDYPCPAVLIGRVYDASGFRPVVNRCANSIGFQIGNPVPVLADGTVGLFPTRTDFVLSGSMAELNPLTASVDGPNPRTGWYPRGKCLLDLKQARGCSVHLEAADGFIRFSDGAEDCSVSVPASWIDKGYSLDDTSAAYRNTVHVRGRTKFSHIAHKAFTETAKSDISVESSPDYASMPLAFDGARWSTGAPWNVPSADLASLSSLINWKFKRAGLTVIDAGTGKLMRATGSGATDPWAEVGGAATITPVANAGLAALLARMSSAPAAGTHWHFVYDHVLTRLGAIFPTGDLLRFHLLTAHNDAARLLNWPSAGGDLTVNGGVTWQPGGARGDGATGYLSSGYVPGSGGETNTNVFVHAHVTRLGSTTNGDTVGSNTKAIRLRAANFANNRAEVGTTSIYSFFEDRPTPRSLAASITSGGTFKQFSNGKLIGTRTGWAAAPLPASIDLLRGFDPGGSVYRYSDDDLLCMAYGKNGSDAQMAALATLTDDLIYLTRFA